MTWISKTITVFGLVVLAHACYSAQEHTALQSLRATSASLASAAAASPAAAASLPLDIAIETVAGLLVATLGLVLGTPGLRPVQWRVWAGKVEREGEQGFLQGGGGGEVERDYVGNPFRALEARPGFLDIRGQRREFAAWVKSEGAGAK